VLVYNHDWMDARTSGRAEGLTLSVRNLPFGGRVKVRQFRIDSKHSDIYAAWQAEGSPSYKAITPEQIKRIKAHDRLEMPGPERTLTLRKGGAWSTELRLEPHGVALFVLTPEK